MVIILKIAVCIISIIIGIGGFVFNEQVSPLWALSTGVWMISDLLSDKR